MELEGDSVRKQKKEICWLYSLARSSRGIFFQLQLNLTERKAGCPAFLVLATGQV